ADRVVVMNAGGVEQIGAPQEIYCSPASPFVARFLDMSNILPGEILVDGEQAVLSSTLGRFPVSHPSRGAVSLLVRPDAARLDGMGSVQLIGELLEHSFRGTSQRIRLGVGEIVLSFDFPTSTPLPPPGSKLRISLDPEQGVIIFPPEG
ncbi:MAG: TOBE domain-containing protein, partial [Anaerolineales bacterium]|nr:TOBE domain-containing protein [Anaerolineales bacterium]